MDRINSRIAQAYGYAVCLICVIVILVSANLVINAAFDYSNPSAATSYGMTGPISSYEAWRIEFDARRYARPNGTSARDTSLTEKDLHQLYESEKAERQNAARFRALRTLVSGIFLLVLASVMFLLHWRWIRRTNAEPVVS